MLQKEKKGEKTKTPSKQTNKNKKQNTEHNKRKRTGCTKYKGWYLLNTW